MMKVNYFYYISKSKVDMLLPQVEPGWKKSLKKLVGSVTFKGVKIDTELTQAADKDLISKLMYLDKRMREHNEIVSLADNAKPHTGVFLDYIGAWRHGLYYFDKDGGPTFCIYMLWRKHLDSLLLLVGSAGNILGENIVKQGTFIPGTSGAAHYIMDFIREHLSTDEPVATALVYPDTSSYYDSYLAENDQLVDVVPEARFRLPVDRLHEWGSRRFTPQANDKATRIVKFCYSELRNLEKAEINSVFRLVNSFEIPEGKEESKQYSGIKQVYIGSPLYTSIG
jgi:hypothetical protein